MATYTPDRYTGPETIEDLTEDRRKIYNGFTGAATGGVIFMVVLLVAMAFFLL
jgi:hypothetical protein